MKQMNASLAIPSTVHTYSVATEYISNWFLSRWSDGFFKTVHVDGKHVFDDFRSFDFVKILKNGKPALAILPRLEFDFNRDMLDTNMFGLDQLLQKGDLKRALIKDTERNLYIGTSLHQLDVRYMFKLRVETRAQQVDMWHFMNMAFRIGHSYTETVDMDFHIPYKLMTQIARDAGLEVIGDKIKDIVGFLNYINSKSELPIIFKLRTINQKMEFFVRFREIDLRVNLLDRMSVDDGEREGALYNNFHIEMEVQLKVPSPKFYVYYSETDHNIDTLEINTFPDAIATNTNYTYSFTPMPKVGPSGWEQLLVTDYVVDEEDLEQDTIEIELDELFDAMRLKKIIEYHNSTNLDSSNYIEFFIINGQNGEVPYSMNWPEMKLVISEKLYSTTSKIGVYVDTEYFHQTNDSLKEIESGRFYQVVENR